MSKRLKYVCTSSPNLPCFFETFDTTTSCCCCPAMIDVYGLDSPSTSGGVDFPFDLQSLLLEVKPYSSLALRQQIEAFPIIVQSKRGQGQLSADFGHNGFTVAGHVLFGQELKRHRLRDPALGDVHVMDIFPITDPNTRQSAVLRPCIVRAIAGRSRRPRERQCFTPARAAFEVQPLQAQQSTTELSDDRCRLIHVFVQSRIEVRTASMDVGTVLARYR